MIILDVDMNKSHVDIQLLRAACSKNFTNTNLQKKNLQFVAYMCMYDSFLKKQNKTKCIGTIGFSKDLIDKFSLNVLQKRQRFQPASDQLRNLFMF